jgi:threonine dehydratase
MEEDAWIGGGQGHRGRLSERPVDVSEQRRLNPTEIDDARARVARWLPPTPLRRSFALTSHNAWLKLECWQPTGWFKVRGALNHLASLSEDDRRRGVVAASAGNHALGVAWAAQALGGRVPAVLFVPESTPRAKLSKLRSFPVTVREVGATYEDAYDASLAYATAERARYLHAFEDPLTAAGQGGIGLEILEQLPEVERIVVPVGGGGLISAIAVAVKARAPGVQIIAVQPEASPSFSESLEQGRPLLRYPARWVQPPCGAAGCPPTGDPRPRWSAAATSTPAISPACWRAGVSIRTIAKQCV